MRCHTSHSEGNAMHTAEISFTVINNNREAAFDVAAELLGIWYKNAR